MGKIALFNTKNRDFFGYKKILNQEKMCYEVIDKITDKTNDKFDLIILPSSEEKTNLKNFKGNIIQLNKFGEKAVRSYFHYQNHKIPFSPLRILVNKFLSQPLKQISLRKHRFFLRDRIRSLVEVEQVKYWPENYQAAFCLRIDVDFPIRYFYKRKKILNALVDFKEELDKLGIPATLFLNLEHLREAMIVKKLFKGYDLQLHGCSKKVPHRRYGYDIKNIRYTELYEMLRFGKEVTGADIFAPPCEQVDERVLEICEKLGFKAVSAGHLGKDDLPYRCFLDREFDLYNIPTTSIELLEEVPLSYYLTELEEVARDCSLFCIYFHPILLLKEKEKLISLLEKVNGTKGVWMTTQSELVDWWDKRDKVEIKSNSTLVNRNDSSVEISIVKIAGSKQNSKKIILKSKQKKKYFI